MSPLRFASPQPLNHLQDIRGFCYARIYDDDDDNNDDDENNGDDGEGAHQPPLPLVVEQSPDQRS